MEKAVDRTILAIQKKKKLEYLGIMMLTEQHQLPLLVITLTKLKINLKFIFLIEKQKVMVQVKKVLKS